MPRLLLAVLLAATLALSGCDSAETRAEKHYQAGMALLEKGDVDRALVEFRNVFQLNGKHLQARLTYAGLVRDRGNLAEAYSQYLLVAEQYPDNVEARIALAEIAIDRSEWAQAERPGREAARLAPEDPMARTIATLLDYRAAVLAKKPAEAQAAAEGAAALMQAHPDNRPLALMAYRVLIDRAITGPDPASALPVLEAALALDPAQFEWQMLKLRLLTAAGDQAAVGADLNALYTLFPQNVTVRNLLISWYLRQKDVDGAEAFLRRVAEDADRAAAAPDAAPDAGDAAERDWLGVIQFLQQVRGIPVALAEADRLIAAQPDRLAYQTMKAGLTFESGDREGAIAGLQAALKTAPDTPPARNMKVALARMLSATGNPVGARALIEEVLASDPSHVAALKMKAAWLIAEDKPGDAILALRTALDQDPRDAEILTLMGQAHERDGARDLAGERYAAAVDVSGRGVAESLRYAAFLAQDARLDAAQSVLAGALQAHPRDAALLAAEADLQIRLRAWDSAATTVAALRALGTPQAIADANRLQANLLLKQEKIDDTIAFLGSLTQGADADRATVAAVVQTQVKAGQIDAARTYLDTLLAQAPQDPGLRFISAGLLVLEDKPDQAETIYRALMEEAPQNLRPFQALYKLLMANDRAAEAASLLDAQLAAQPDSPLLNLMRAGEKEKAGDIDGAITIYEALYARDSGNLILANNLASLLVSWRDDPASLDRAFAIAARLRGTQVPAFQDTYGWIQYRRGDYEAALADLEPAAAGLPKDPMVQMHLGLAYAALKRTEDARRVLAQALDLAGAAADTPAYAPAQKALADLGGAPQP